MTAPSKAKTAPAVRALKGDGDTASSFAENVKNDPLFVTARKGSDKEAAYADKSRTYEYRRLGYQLVDPKDIETMEFNQEYPAEKEFGVYLDVDRASATFEAGQHVLMWTYTKQKEARQLAERNQSAALREVRKADETVAGKVYTIEQEATLEEETTVGKFLGQS